MAATTKLIVWNAALRELGSQPLADTTTANTRQYELNASWDHAIEHALAMRDWGFARRRASLSGVSDTTSFPPYVYRYSKPSDFLRKCWVKASAADEFQVDHAEIAAAFYGMQPNAVIEYVSDHVDNYDPANWPPHFTRVLTIYLASLVAAKLARAGAGEIGMLDGKMQTAMTEAEAQEAVFLTSVAIPSNRNPTMRRAMEFLGQQLAGSVAIHSHVDMLRWHMQKSWDHAVRYVLEQGAWNFATRRAILTGAAATMPGSGSTDGLIEGYSYGTATDPTADLPDMEGYGYGHTLPSDYLHKIWIKTDAQHDFECRHQLIGDAIWTDSEHAVLEYVGTDSASTDPANWPATFTEAVAAYLALLVTPELLVTVGQKGGVRVNANDLRNKLEAVYERKLSDARMKDAIQQDVKRVPLGRFARARFGSIGTTSIRRYN